MKEQEPIPIPPPEPMDDEDDIEWRRTLEEIEDERIEWELDHPTADESEPDSTD